MYMQASLCIQEEINMRADIRTQWSIQQASTGGYAGMSRLASTQGVRHAVKFKRAR